MPNLLIVDDSRTSRLLIQEMTKQLHPEFQIIEACDGKDALRKLNHLREPLMFATIDMHMPGIDGLTLASVLRMRYPDAHLGLITGETENLDFDDMKRLNVSLIKKPISNEKLTRFLSQNHLE
jgi:two-component system, chemotaxis family, chemotaxis protein CheY